ncbi:heterokaryon incompatibility protein-domain-containing protein [Hypoxylon trugodes]|uniref:heterokaryon incompatibility protein-domain-containing protein n=1 Tax=Hypoxylon trugodes TaxID=326681 RepID=UPI00218CC7C8|nr:heterokaryon incompatibility protein-domain-containing protein [Hypoxylon trugodes]KAI1382969.1 heterokaryon incompatibility protein-domain-containing protein [Hypoxylon trugodes]
MASELVPSHQEISGSTTRFGPLLCDYCQKIFSLLESQEAEQLKCDYHPTVCSLRDAAESGCRICLIYYDKWQRNDFGELWGRRMIEVSRQRHSVILLELYSFEERSALVQWGGTFHIIAGAPHNHLAYPGSSRREKVRKELVGYREQHYSPPNSTDSLQAWELCRSWIEICIKNHKDCRKLCPSGEWWPTRLLYVGNLSDDTLGDNNSSLIDVELHETRIKKPKGSYMTLSHCWGDPNKIPKLTMETYEHRIKNGISFRDLPKTFQDAIRLCRFLRSEYLWIDSLCIIQHSKEDWERESVTMADVYRYSRCNIAATASRGPSEGCFHPRDPRLVSPLEITLDTKEGKEKYLFLDNDMWNSDVEEAPLNKRAWVQQERLLAPRQIHCGRQQLFWECPETSKCETYPFILDFEVEFMPQYQDFTVKPPSLSPTFLELSRLGSSEARHNESPNCRFCYKHTHRDIHYGEYAVEDMSRIEEIYASLERATRDELVAHMRRHIYQDWTNIVEHYSKCALSVKTDKLVAISAISSRIWDTLEGTDEYVAGMWRSQLLSHLLWRPVSGKSIDESSYKTGPSWSWASSDAEISFRVFGIGWESEYASMIDVLSMYDGHTINGTNEPTLESPIELRCYLYQTRPLKETNEGYAEFYITAGKEEVELTVTEDSKACTKYWDHAFAIPIRISDTVEGIIVKPCEGRPGYYRRIACWLKMLGRERLVEYMGSRPDEERVTITLI